MPSLKLSRIACALMVVMALSSGTARAQNNFGVDVTNTIDAWLGYARSANLLNPANQASGLVVIAFLEKRASATPGDPILGYTGSSAGDQCLLRNAVRGIIAGGGHVARGSFYSYVDGIDMMALSLYTLTGGPDPNAAVEVCPGAQPPGATLSVTTAINTMVDRSVLGQTPGVPAAGSAAGSWYYTGPGPFDSSTTQFTAGGLAAARGFYLANPDPARLAAVDAALAKARSAYTVNIKPAVGVPPAEGGWGYTATVHPPSSQQTASGLWVVGLGGADINDPAVQRAMNWQRNHYIYSTPIIDPTNGWTTLSYSYYLFSSSKAYTLFELGAPPLPGNIGTNDLGTLPAAAPRQAQRNPLTDPCARPAPFVCASAGPSPYAAETPRWYYDYAYTIMSRQNAAGSINETLGGPADGVASQAYYALVLQRSLGGACVDTDGDGHCDDLDNCPSIANPGQENTYGDARGDACEPNPTVRLNVSTAPGSGTAGVSNVAVTGALFPAGDYVASDITIFVGTACQAGVVVSTPATTLTTIAGATKRASFKIPAAVTPGARFVWLNGPGFSSVNCSKLTVIGGPPI